MPVGATLVRHSDPAGEVAETHAKAAGVLAALGVRPARPGAGRHGPRLADDPRVRAALDARRAAWRRSGCGCGAVVRSRTGTALVVDAEDTFTAMLAHLLRSSGLPVTVLRHDEPGLGRRCWSTPARWSSARGPATRGTPRTPGCGSCAGWPRSWCGTTGTGCWASAWAMS